MSTTDKLPVIGAETIYTGSSTALGGRGSRVKVIGIIRRGEPEDSPDAVVRDDDRLAALGGVRSSDGADVLVWNHREARWGWVGIEVENICELELFEHLRQGEQP